MIGAVCAVTGASVAGIATSSAATTATAAKATSTDTRPDDDFGHGGGGRGGHGGGIGGGGGVHSESVRADADGSGFTTTVDDSGTLTAVSGASLTIKEGTATETYDTVKVTAKGTVTLQRNGVTSKLSALKVGDRVRVSTDGTTTRIDATTEAYEKTRAEERAQREEQRDATASWPAA